VDDNLFNTITLEMPGNIVSKLLQTGIKTNYGEGGYLQLLGNNPEGTALNGKAISPTQTYKVVMPAFMAAGNEANLEFLKDYLKTDPVETVTIGAKTLKNDLRDLVIDYMRTL
jgi:2',3'-cyclic-nucleotide 2'-phosphodiesterase (5'-nucleotidase family)